MAHPVIWPRKNFFYPIGNTPPVCLTRHLAPEENADLLLLGCGDPRSILHTIHADLGSVDRKLDFTCCDAEPAIIARNILLLTLISDGEAPMAIWDLFYHFFLSDPRLGLLQAQCRKLIELSTDLESWIASKYGVIFRFCTEQSMVETRRHWILYLEMDKLPIARKDAIRKSFTDGMKATHSKYHYVATAIHAAGPLFLEVMDLGAEHFKEFWMTGVTMGKQAETISIPHLNPAFVYSRAGWRFNVHYGTDPILAFHLAPVLTSVKGSPTPPKVTTQDIVDFARIQFTMWCTSFKARVSNILSSKTVIRFFVGDALAFSQALHYCGQDNITETGVYTNPWGGTQVNFSNQDYAPNSLLRAPLAFDVIDTSNLTDHLGLLNLLISNIPLLRRKPSSVIHTNTLLRSDTNGPLRSDLMERTLANIPTFSLLLGIVPSPYLSHFMSQSNRHGILASSITPQHPEDIAWKFPCPSIPGTRHEKEDTMLNARLGWDAKELGQFLHMIYLNMFSDERKEGLQGLLSNPSIGGFRKQSNLHYLRGSFVAFLGLVKEQAETDWEQTMSHFVDLVGIDRSLLMGLNNYQDLCCHLYLRNLFAVDTLIPDYVETRRSASDRFHGWLTIPAVVCIVLKVPRQKIKVLEDIDPDVILTPMLQCESRGSNFHNLHPSIQPLFGDLEVSNIQGEPKVIIREDPMGWNGKSPLIVTFYMPSWILTYAPQSTWILLSVRSTPGVSAVLRRKLGFLLTVFETSLSDTNNVQVVRERPGNSGEIGRLCTIPSIVKQKTNKMKVSVQLDASGTKATSLTIRHDVTTAEARKSLSNKAAVTTAPVSDQALLVSFGNYKQLFINPLPIRGSQCKTRIARQSFYVEVVSPIRQNFEDPLDLSLNPFPISSGHQNLNLLNIHYITLDCLPALQLPMPPNKIQWLSVHLAMALSEREKALRERSVQKDRGTLVNLKESIAAMFVHYSGLQSSGKDRKNIFGLSNPGVGIYALIFINDLRLDLACHTVIADACVVPLTESIMPKIERALQQIHRHAMTEIFTLDDETVAWKMLLPALAERCRTWKHLSTCEYLVRGVPSMSEGFEESPLCSCGNAKNLGAFATKPEFRTFFPWATRIALSQLFAFPPQEEIGASVHADLAGSAESKSSHPQPSASTPASTQCAQCGGPGDPTLLSCSACKSTKYCSKTCQKTHWKVHKSQCLKGS